MIAKNMDRILSGENWKIPEMKKQNYPKKVLEYTQKHGVSKELFGCLEAHWLINSALSEDKITAPPQNDSIVKAYIEKWVEPDGDTHFYNQVVVEHFTEEQL